MRARKRKGFRNKRWVLPAAVITAIMAVILLVYALSFSSAPVITPSGAHTNDTLNCEWTLSGTGTLTANVTWYNGSVEFRNETGISCTAGNPCQTANDIEGNYVYRNEKWYCEVKAYNGTDAIRQNASKTIQNADPVIADMSNVSWPEDSAYSDSATATDAESDTLTWFSNDEDFADDLFVIDSNTGAISFTPDLNDIGNHSMVIIVIDGKNGSDTVTVGFEIVARNDEPYFDPSLTDQTAEEDTYFEYIITGTDEESDTFNWSMECPTLSDLILINVSDTQANITFSDNNGAPEFADAGEHNVTVVIYDVANTSVKTNTAFLLNITAINQEPKLDNVSNKTGAQGGSFALEVNATDLDSGDTLSFGISAINCSLDNPWSIITTKSTPNGTAWINATLNNTHVVCRDVNVTVSDGVASDFQVVFFNITNVNDYPAIYNFSNYDRNNAGSNISDLSGGVGAEFVYKVNATDIDNLTYEGETWNFTCNDTSLWSIDTGSGLINVTMNSSHVGNHTLNITVEDDAGLIAYVDMQIEIVNNTIPVLEPIAPISCTEDVLCTHIIVANDPDTGENLTFTSNNTATFNIEYYNTTAAILNTTYTENYVGNYSIRVRVTDAIGATDYEDFAFVINNTNDAPFFDMDQDNVTDNIIFGNVVENLQFTYIINASDFDFKFGDTLSFNDTFISGPFSDLFNMTQIDSNSALVGFIPNSSCNGEYSINITVLDLAGAYDFQVLNFTVYNESLPPSIDMVRPYYNTTSGTTMTGWGNASLFPNNQTSVTFDENTTIIFDANVSDPDSGLNNITLYWYVNGSLNHTVNASLATNLTLYYDFFDAGTRNISLTVQDNFYSNIRFDWDVTITNVNRAPQLLNGLDNFTGADAINLTTEITDYFGFRNAKQRFIDPDDDLNSNNQVSGNPAVDPGETFSLTVNATSCSVASLSISGDDLTITPNIVGICYVNFTASDSADLYVTSGMIRIDVEDVPEGNTSDPTPTTSTSSGSATTTRTVTREEEVDVPEPLQIVTPGELIIYENRTMTVPIIVKNTWTDSLYSVSLNASTPNMNVSLNFSTDYVSEIPEGEEFLAELTIHNYRESGPYEIYVSAVVDDPDFIDTGTIFVNSIEKSQEGDEVKAKVTFARDLLASNVECQELNELLDLAEKELENHNYQAAMNIVDSAINGCKYLIQSVSESKEETPSEISFALFSLKSSYVKIILIAIGILVIFFLVTLIIMGRKNPVDEDI